MKYGRLKFKILFIIVLISVVLLGIISYYNYTVQQKLLFDVSNEKLMVIMKTIRKNEKDSNHRYI